MANDPIDCSTKLGASSNSALVVDTTNPAPPKKSGSSSSHSAPEKDDEKKNGLLKKTTATLTPPLGQFFINMILQIAAFAAAIAFGVFAVKSIDIARTANEYSASANSYAAQALEEARVANQVAMLAVCSQTADVQNSSFAAFCVRVLNGAPMVMPDAASNLFTKISTATTPITVETTSSSASIVPTSSFNQSTHIITGSVMYTTIPRTSSSQPTPKSSEMAHPTVESNPGDNKRKNLAIALPISLSPLFVIAIIAIVAIVRSKARSKLGNGQEEGPQPDLVIASRAKDHEDGDAALEYGHTQYASKGKASKRKAYDREDGDAALEYGHTQYASKETASKRKAYDREDGDAALEYGHTQYECEPREHGKDQADLLFEYEGWLMGVQNIHQKTNYLSNGKAVTFQEIGGRPSGLISWTQLFRRIKSSISSNGKVPAPRKMRGRKIHPGRNNIVIEIEMNLLKGWRCMSQVGA